MTLKEKLKEFDDKFPNLLRAELDENDNYNGEIKQFISTAIQEALESLQGEEKLVSTYELDEDGYENIGWNDREKKLREDISKFLNN